MTSATTETGRKGKFVVGSNLVARLTQWSVAKTLATSTEWGDSDGNGFTNRAPGRKDATFSTEGKYDTDNEQFDIFQPEDIAAADLWMNNVALYWHFPRAMCSDFNLTVNVDTEEVIGWTSDWGSDGVFYFPGENGAPQRNLPGA